MATLTADFQARTDTQRQKELTNPNARESDSVITALIDTAATDVQGAFKRLSGNNYDSDNPSHVEIAVEGVTIKLQRYAGNAMMEDVWKDWEKRVQSLGRIAPTTTSVLNPADEVSGSRPDFDLHSTFESLKPNQPR